MPADQVFPPADRPAVQVEVDGQWCDGELYAWQVKRGEQWAMVSWTHDGERFLDTFPAERVRKAGLSDVHYRMLDFERDNTHWAHGGTKESAVLERFQWSMVRYYSVLNWVIEQAEAVEYAPGTVRRLVRLRDGRREARGSRTAE